MKHVLATGLAAMLCTLISLPVAAQSPMGNWARGDGNARVRIAPCGANICATNIWIKNPGDEKVGDVLLMKVKKNGSGEWQGSAYDRQRKLSISMTMDVGKNKMTTRGCVVGGLICRSTTWTRLK